MKKLRLLITEKCNRSCAGCCNKQWDLSKLPVTHDFTKYDLIMLTGGEPLLYPATLLAVVAEIRKQNPQAQIIVYTAYAERVLWVLPWVDGITLTLHAWSDVNPFYKLDNLLHDARETGAPWVKNLSLRLNVFAGVEHVYNFNCWEKKVGIEWIEDCPLPDDEVFMRV